MSNNPSVRLRRRSDGVVDGENNAVVLDALYSVVGDELMGALVEINRVHGPRIYLLPMSGISGGGGIFQVNGPGDGEVVGLHLTPTPSPRVSRTNRCDTTDITRVALDQIVIDERQRRIYAGSSITLDQLNQALAYELGMQYRVLGADLTSYTYAQVGATFMTGGMGPQRRYFSDSVNEVALYDGKEIVPIRSDLLLHYAGTYGWSGLVTAVCCDYYEAPVSEFAFALPVNDTPEDLARLLDRLSPYAYLRLRDGKVTATDGGTELILGIEHITVASMQPMLAQNAHNPIAKQAKQLERNCVAAKADGLVFVNGYSNKDPDEFLLQLIDDQDSETYSMAGVDLEHTEMFGDAEQMRSVRESIPAAARTQAPQGEFVYKGHTDANIMLDPERVGPTMRELWRVNQEYVNSVEDYFRKSADLRGEILIYGHLNPVGVDPHNRITFACDDEAVYQDAGDYLRCQRNRFFRALGRMCAASKSLYIGGEKSAGTEHQMFPAFNGVDGSPPALREKFARQSKVIRAASPMFNWRAPAPYV